MRILTRPWARASSLILVTLLPQCTVSRDSRRSPEEPLARPSGGAASPREAQIVWSAWKEHRFDEAIEQASAFLTDTMAGRDSEEVAVLAGRSAVAIGRFECALGFYSRARAFHESAARPFNELSAELLLGEAQALIALGKTAEAKERLSELMANATDSPEAQEARTFQYPRLRETHCRMLGLVGMDYDGRFRSSPALPDCLASLCAEAEKARQEVWEALGLAETDKVRFEVLLTDLGRYTTGTRAWTTTILRGDTPGVAVFVASEPLMGGITDVRKILKHEITHCVQMHYQGDNMWRPPTWLREGVAMWVSGEAKDEVNVELLANPDQMADVSMITSRVRFRSMEYPWSYVAGAMAFNVLESRVGQKKCTQIVRNLVRSEEWEGLMGEAGLTAEAWEETARGAIATALAGESVCLWDLLECKKLAERGHFEEAATKCDLYLSRFPDSVLAPMALFGRGYCRVSMGLNREAMEDFRAFRKVAPLHVDVVTSFYWEAVAAERERDYSRARLCCERFLAVASGHWESYLDAAKELLRRVKGQ